MIKGFYNRWSPLKRPGSKYYEWLEYDVTYLSTRNDHQQCKPTVFTTVTCPGDNMDAL